MILSPGWALLAVSALIASLFAVGAAPAAAIDDDSKPDAPAATSACVGDATGDMMFSDVSEMHTFRGDINCLAYYGVTIGFGDGTFRPEDDVSRGQMVLFMERAAAIAGADAEAVVGDFATTGSDPVNRADMALLIARLLVSATTAESTPNVTNNADGTFAVSTVATADYFADARRSLNRVSDSAVSALYELGVAKGTGMGYFSPADSVSRGQMAAFITRALGHTTARPAGVSIQSDEPGGVIVSVRDANFHPLANAQLDVFSSDNADEAFKADGSCDARHVEGEGGNAMACEIDGLDAVTGLSGDYDPSTISVADGGTTVWAWTGDIGDKVEDGGEGLASTNLTAAPPVMATGTKITDDLGENVERAVFGSTVTITIQLVGAGNADAVPPSTGVTYTVVIRSGDADSGGARTDVNQATDDPSTNPAVTGTGKRVSTRTVTVDASGKATFTITEDDPDSDDTDDAAGATVDWTTVTYTVTAPATHPVVAAVSDTDGSGVQTIRFSDAPSVARRTSVTPAADYLAAPSSGAASNVVTVTVVDQYGKPVRGQGIVLTGAAGSNFPTARTTDSSGTVRIGYSKTGSGLIETLTADTSPTDLATTVPAGTAGTADFYWVAPVAAPVAPATSVAVAAAALRVADVENNTVIIGGDTSNAPQLLVYDDNDQFVVDGSNSTMAAFEAALATALTTDTDNDNTLDDDEVGADQYNSADPSVIARFTLTRG